MLLIPVLNPPTKKRSSKKSASRSKKVATKKKSGGKKTRKKTGPGSRGGTYRTAGSKYTRKTGMTYTEAAKASGAVYPKKYPAWHKKAGQSTGAMAGKVMPKADAVRWKRPVVGWFNRAMINQWHDPDFGGATARKNSKQYKEALARFQDAQKRMKSMRKEQRRHWKRKPQRYKRGPKKGQYKKDYYVTKDGEVRFRSGRGPVRLVRTYRGFGPADDEITELVSGGYGGHKFAPGGKVKLNRPRRRKKARRRTAKKNPGRKKAKARKNPRRRRKTKASKKTRKNPRRRKAKARKNPRRKARSRKKKSTRLFNNPRRRRRRRKTKVKAKANPRRRRRRKTKARKNPGRKRRRRRGRRYGLVRRNPRGILKAMMDDVKSTPKWLTAVHVTLGMGINAKACHWLLDSSPLSRVGFLTQRGILGSTARLALCGVSAAGLGLVGHFLSKALGNPKLLRGARTNLLIGGLAYAAANFAYEVAPGLASMFMIPQISPAPSRMTASAGVSGWGPDYKYGYGGMGAVVSPEDLVAGESLARNVNEFSGMGDWMELSGLGSSGGAPVPMEDLRGYPGQYGGGMGDWVELTSNNALVRAGFDPGVEAF